MQVVSQQAIVMGCDGMGWGSYDATAVAAAVRKKSCRRRCRRRRRRPANLEKSLLSFSIVVQKNGKDRTWTPDGEESYETSGGSDRSDGGSGSDRCDGGSGSGRCDGGNDDDSCGGGDTHDTGNNTAAALGTFVDFPFVYMCR